MDFAKVSDEQLVGIIRTKDRELYGEIIRRYSVKLSHYVRKFVHDLDELEDVLQVVFIKTYQNLYGFDEHKKFSSWIYRIAHNEAINHMKKYTGKQVPLDEWEYKIIDTKIAPEEELDRALLKEKVARHLGLVKIKYREPLILFYFEQKTYTEISDILRIPVSTVGTLISRGKKMLRKNYDQQ